MSWGCEMNAFFTLPILTKATFSRFSSRLNYFKNGNFFADASRSWHSGRRMVGMLQRKSAECNVRFLCASWNVMTIDFWLSSIVRREGNAKRRQWIETKPLTRAHFLCLISLVHVYMQILAEHLHKKYAWHGRLGVGLGDEWKAHKKSREFFRIFFSSGVRWAAASWRKKFSHFPRLTRSLGGARCGRGQREKGWVWVRFLKNI